MEVEGSLLKNMLHKIICLSDDNKSWTTQACGFILTGNKSKRTVLAKLHRKKCETCKNIDVSKCVEIPLDVIPLRKQSYVDYEYGVNRRQGAFNPDKVYVLENKE